jgi:hypothetical protein
MNETEQSLAALRKTLKGKVREDGIFLVATFRYEPDAKWVARTARELGARNPLVYKIGKTEYRNYRASRTWYVRFTIGIEADQYLTGRVNMRGYREMLRFAAARRAQA